MKAILKTAPMPSKFWFFVVNFLFFASTGSHVASKLLPGLTVEQRIWFAAVGLNAGVFMANMIIAEARKSQTISFGGILLQAGVPGLLAGLNFWHMLQLIGLLGR